MKPLTFLERRRRTIYLALFCIPIVIGLMTRWGIQISFWGCPFIQWLGIPCMGWGMSRSFYATAQGHLTTAIQFNLFGPTLFVGLIVIALHLSLELIQNRSIQNFFFPGLQEKRSWLFGIFLMSGYHTTRLAELHHSGQLQTWIQQSYLRNLF